MAALGQEDMMSNGKEPIELRVIGAGAATIMEFWTTEGYDIGLLIGVAVVTVRSRLGGDEGAGSILSSVSFEGDNYGNLDGAGPGECDPLGIS